VNVHQSFGLFVNGSERPALSGGTFDTLDPSTGAVLAQVALATAEDIDMSVRAAHEAWQRDWRHALPSERHRVLVDIGAALAAASDEVCDIAAQDGGLRISAVRSDLAIAARYFQFYAGLADKPSGHSIPLGPDFVDYTVREPWGVCGVIMPFNSPFQLMARSVAAGLAAGNAMVVKPGEQAPIGPILLARVASRAGLPAGLIQVLSGYGDVGTALVEHPLVRHVTFTGSVTTARAVMRSAAANITPVLLELGGKSPQIVFQDADIEAAAEVIGSSLLYYAGQTCSAGTRVLVHRSVQADLVDALEQRIRRAGVGPAVGDSEVGPLISRKQLDSVLEKLVAAEATSARLILGGLEESTTRLSGGGFFAAPTMYVDVEPQSSLAREEVFGPVLAVSAFDDDDQAVLISNDSDYGLAAGVWTRDLSRGLRMARDLEVGQVFVNNYRGGIEIPFGGYKHSGMGREKGIEGFLAYTQVKNVCIAV